MKTCKGCGSLKPLEEFYKHHKNQDGRDGKCKECRKEQSRMYRHKNIERVREYDRKRGQNPDRMARNRRNYRKRISTPEGRAAEWEKKRSYMRSDKRAANVITSNAIRSGKLTRQPCERCGAEPAEAHHEDYTKPLDVNWLCKTCHGARHREINEERRKGG